MWTATKDNGRHSSNWRRIKTKKEKQEKCVSV